MVEAYVTVITAAGTAQEAIEGIRNVEGVEKAHIVAGEFDIVAQVTADEERDLLRLVTDEIQPIDGVGRTSTYIVLE